MPKSTSVFVVLLFLFAFAIRFGVVMAFRDLETGPNGGTSDDDVQFEILTRNLVEGHGYALHPGKYSSFRAPGFPFALAILYRTVGDHPTAAYTFFCLLGALTCVLTYQLARELLTETGARLTGVLNAIYLPHAYFATYYLSENLYIPLIAFGLWCCVRFAKGGSIGWIVLAGAVLGYATLTRPGTILMLPLIPAAYLVYDLRSRAFRPVAYAAYCVAFVAVLFPWMWRNHEVHGHWVLVATNGGSTFWGANNDRVLYETKHLGYWLPTTQLPNRDLVEAAPNEYEHDQVEWKLGKDWVRANLSSMPKLVLFKLARMWWLPDYGVGLRWLRIVSYTPFFALFALYAVRCLWRSSNWTVSWAILHASTLVLLATVVIFFGEPRFRDAQTPVLMIYAVLGLNPRFIRADADDAENKV